MIKEKDPSILQDKLSKYISLIKSDIYKGIISRDTEALNYAVRERILETQKIKDILEDDPEKAVNQLNRLLNLFPLTQEQYTELIAQYPGESTAQLILKELQEIRLIPLTELNERYTQEIEAKNAEILEKRKILRAGYAQTIGELDLESRQRLLKDLWGQGFEQEFARLKIEDRKYVKDKTNGELQGEYLNVLDPIVDEIKKITSTVFFSEIDYDKKIFNLISGDLKASELEADFKPSPFVSQNSERFQKVLDGLEDFKQEMKLRNLDDHKFDNVKASVKGYFEIIGFKSKFKGEGITELDQTALNTIRYRLPPRRVNNENGLVLVPVFGIKAVAVLENGNPKILFVQGLGDHFYELASLDNSFDAKNDNDQFDGSNALQKLIDNGLSEQQAKEKLSSALGFEFQIELETKDEEVVPRIVGLQINSQITDNMVLNGINPDVKTIQELTNALLQSIDPSLFSERFQGVEITNPNLKARDGEREVSNDKLKQAIKHSSIETLKEMKKKAEQEKISNSNAEIEQNPLAGVLQTPAVVETTTDIIGRTC